MCRRGWLLPVLLLLCVFPAAAAGRGLHGNGAKLRPRTFRSCSALVRYARRHLAVTHGVPEMPVAAGEPAPVAGAPGARTPQTSSAPAAGGSTAAPTHSTTNVQEPGVDEPDIVKTDGSTIFAVAGNTLYAVAVAGGQPRIAGSLDLGSTGYGAQLLLRGTRLLVISGGGPRPLPLGAPAPVMSSPYFFYGARTVLTEIDVHDPVAMRITRTLAIDGSFVDARENGSVARIVISSAARAIATPALRARAAGWVPMRSFHSLVSGRRSLRRVSPCDAVRRPVAFSGLGMLTIVTVDLDRGLSSAGSDALMADAQVVYGSQSSLYVATQRWIDPSLSVDRLPPAQSTVIDRLDATSGDHTTFVASGEVPGYLLNQFSLSEYNGYLRAATTSRPVWWGTVATPNGGEQPPPSQSYVTVLATRGAALVPVGQVAGLGLGQRIYSVRFVADSGYVVTFRQFDPLYTIDLRTPTAPRVAGKLELAGYSAYLHPLDHGLLLGVGADIESNEPSATQLELFDVADPAAPRLLARTTLDSGSSSEALFDHHAFLFWPPTGLAVLPVEIFSRAQSEPPQPGPQGTSGGGSGSASGSGASSGPGSSGDQFVGAIGFHVGRGGIAEVGRISHDAVNGYVPPIHRSLVIGDRLFTLSDDGVMASALTTLARESFVAFPAPANQPGPVASGGGTAAPSR